MAWIKLYEVTLNASLMCAGLPDFKPYVPYFLVKGLEKGKYKILYAHGAVRSHNLYRFKLYIPNFELKWNKYYTFLLNDIKNISFFDYKFFPELKFNVFQCQFGTLPGITSVGASTKKLAQIFASGKDVPEYITELINDDIKPLLFLLLKKTNISFWYTDNCAPCVEGSITYNIYILSDSANTEVNSISIISYNIKNLQPNKSLYYELNNLLKTKYVYNLYEYVLNLILYEKNKNYIISLKDYNTIGYNKNSILNSNLYVSYKQNSLQALKNNIYWKLTKIKNNSFFNLLTEIKSYKQIPLFSNIYTLIPSTSENLEGTIDIDNNSINLSGKYFNFIINNTTNVIFNTNAYLYIGKITNNDIKLKNDNYLYNHNTLINIDEQEIIDNKLNILQDINIINNNFYLYMDILSNQQLSNNELPQQYIKIISNVIIEDNINIQGPYKTLLDAKLAIKNYCMLTNLLYLLINETLYALGKKED